MPESGPEVALVIERLIVAGVAATTVALADVRPRLDLTFAQWRALLIVGRASDGLTVSEVARRIGTTLPATSRQLRRLEGRGLLALATDDIDRRATRARITPDGEEWRRAILDHRRQSIAAALPTSDPSADSGAWLAELADRLDEVAGRRAARASRAAPTPTDAEATAAVR